MADDKNQPKVDPTGGILNDFSTRLNEIEEKQRLLKDRTLLIGENLITTKEDYEKEFINIKKRLNNLESEIKTSRQLTQRIINELDNLAKKSEIEILERQFKMFEPLGYVRPKDVREIIKEELLKKST